MNKHKSNENDKDAEYYNNDDCITNIMLFLTVVSWLNYRSLSILDGDVISRSMKSGRTLAVLNCSQTVFIILGSYSNKQII